MSNSKWLKEYTDEETRKVAFTPTSEEIIKEIAGKIEGEFIKVRKPQKRVAK